MGQYGSFINIMKRKILQLKGKIDLIGYVEDINLLEFF